MDTFSFDAGQYEPSQDLSDPIPAGWYGTIITGSQLKPTKAGTGTRLEIEHTVVDGECKGRKVWSRFNVRNPSEQAEEIGRKELSALCHATGVLKFKTPEQLHDKKCLVRVIVKQDQGYQPGNEVKAWKEFLPLASAPTPAAAPRAATRVPAKPQPSRVPEKASPTESWREDDDSGLPF